VSDFGLQGPITLSLETRQRNQIENYIDPVPPLAGVRLQVEAYRRQYLEAQHRPVGPSTKYNCHGLTFASRRTWIDKPGEVEKILRDDGYVEIKDFKDVLVGDIAIWRSASATNLGEIEHSGIVVTSSVNLDGLASPPWILSKWGKCHEVVHKANDGEWTDHRVHYYRLMT
jgi:hypothetical protein